MSELYNNTSRICWADWEEIYLHGLYVQYAMHDGTIGLATTYRCDDTNRFYYMSFT